MLNKKSQEEKLIIKQKVKKVSRTIIKYALIFIFTIVILMLLPNWEKYIIYAASLLGSSFVLLVIKNEYVNVERLGLGKTRKQLEKEINKQYFKYVIISMLAVACLVIIDWLVYHLTVNIKFVVYLYLFGLNIFTLPMNYILNIRQKIIIRILIVLFNVAFIIGSYYLYFIKNYFHLSYILLSIILLILFIFRQRGYHKKDL